MRRLATSSMTTGRAPASRLTRRAFLQASALVAGLGGAVLAGCDTPPVAGPRLVPTPGIATSPASPAGVLPAGLGVNLHPTQAARAQVAQLAAVGFRFVRLDLLWDQVERRRGHYDFSTYEPLLGALRTSGVRPLCLLAYGNALYEPASAPPSTVAGLHTDVARQLSRVSRLPLPLISRDAGSSGISGMSRITRSSGSLPPRRTNTWPWQSWPFPPCGAAIRAR